MQFLNLTIVTQRMQKNDSIMTYLDLIGLLTLNYGEIINCMNEICTNENKFTEEDVYKRQ